MKCLPTASSDEQILAFLDQWVRLLEGEDYDAAYALTDHVPGSSWTPALIRDVIKAYGDPGSDIRVTLEGRPTDVHQRKEVVRQGDDVRNYIGYAWYDLNLNGLASDLTATFDLIVATEGISIQLNDIHVM
jgi:hypothetical protein